MSQHVLHHRGNYIVRRQLNIEFCDPSGMSHVGFLVT
jgi:hypothetical protein